MQAQEYTSCGGWLMVIMMTTTRMMMTIVIKLMILTSATHLNSDIETSVGSPIHWLACAHDVQNVFGFRHAIADRAANDEA
jgi:hypothetical protein